jgi:tetratricopeptide (TPR) repeat protein
VVCILLAGIVWIVFGQNLNHEFVNYDDGAYVYANPRITSGLTLDDAKWAFTHFRAGNWQPLTAISHMLECQLYGLQPWGHHLSNILLHVAAVILLFLALWRLTDILWVSAFVAALFAIHPLRVEPVAWVSGRGDVLSGMFFMLTLLAYARHARSDRFSLGRYATVLALFVLGLMCKPTLVTVPFVLLLSDYWPLGRVSWRPARHSLGAGRWSVVRVLLLEKIPFFALSAASCIAAILAREVTPREIHHAFAERAGNAALFYVAYLGQMIYPAHLAALYPIARADRYTYLSEIGLYIAGTWGAMELFKSSEHKHEILSVAALVITGAFITHNYFQGAYWQNSETLWRHTVAVTHDNYIAQNNLGGTLLEKGQLNEAIAHYREAVEIKPDVPEAQSNLGNALVREGEVEEAIDHLQKALQIDPAYAEAYNYMGNALMKKGEAGEAVRYYQKAVTLDTSYAAAHNNLGAAFWRNGQLEEAIAHYKQAVAIKPGSAEMQFNLGNALARQGDWAGAIASYEAALSTERDFVKAAKVRNNLGGALERIGKATKHLNNSTKPCKSMKVIPRRIAISHECWRSRAGVMRRLFT